MRYDHAVGVRSTPFVNPGGNALHRPASTMRLGDRDEAASRQAAELDVWEDEGGTIAGQAPEFPRGHAKQHFDEFSG
jgi:hypothetical protein